MVAIWFLRPLSVVVILEVIQEVITNFKPNLTKITFLVLPTLTMKEAEVENSAAKEQVSAVERRMRRSILIRWNLNYPRTIMLKY